MIREFKDYLDDMFRAINNIIDYTKELNFNNFKKNKLIIDAVIRNFEALGEAAGKIPQRIIKKYNNIKWKEISGMRNKIIHEYFSVDEKIIWDTIQKDIPELLEKIKVIIEKECKI